MAMDFLPSIQLTKAIRLGFHFPSYERIQAMVLLPSNITWDMAAAR
jgi:hypothetical protein